MGPGVAAALSVGTGSTAIEGEHTMYETYLTVVGTIVSKPDKRRTLDGTSIVSFRMASNERRMDRATGEWGAGDSLYVGVTCWRGLADNAHATLLLGDPVIVRGRLLTREFEDREGRRRSVIELEATAVGPNLLRATANVVRLPRSDPQVAASSSDDAGGSGDPWTTGPTAAEGSRTPGEPSGVSSPDAAASHALMGTAGTRGAHGNGAFDELRAGRADGSDSDGDVGGFTDEEADMDEAVEAAVRV